jgi:integrase
VTSASTTALERLADTIREHSSSVATWRNRWRAVAMALAWGHRKGLVAANNAPAVRINAPRSDREAKGKVPSRAGLRRLVAAIRPDPGARPSLADAYLITALTTGARVSELIALGQDELDLEHGRLSVRRRLEVRSSRVGPPKSRAAFRTIPLSATTVSVLRRWLAIVPRSSSSVIDQVGSPLVFPHASGGFLTHSMVRQSILHPALKAAKLVDAQDNPLYRVHDLRHAAASLMIDARLSVKEIQRVLGHSSATMTLDTYGHLFADDAADRAIAGAIDQALAR